MRRLDDLQKLVANVLTGLAVIQTAVLIVINSAVGRGQNQVVFAAVIFALLPVVLTLLARPSKTIGFSLAVSLISQTALLVYIFESHPWQVEMHFYFFATLAMIAGFCEAPILLTAAGLTVIHHIVFNGIVPDALYPGGGDILRLAVHAGIVVIETTMLILIARMIKASFTASANATATAEDAAVRLEGVGIALEEQLAATSKRADTLEKSLATFRSEIAPNLDQLLNSSVSLNGSADDFAQALGLTGDRAAAVSRAADGANRRVGDVAAAGRTYLAVMADIGEHASKSARMGVRAVEGAEETKGAMDELSATSRRIEGAVKLIGDIAAQTNMLALNATIEAARAGEHGRGFSAVASEVKSLANATSRAAASVADMVQNIRASTERSVVAMTLIAETIRTLNVTTAGIADAVTERVYVASTMAENVDAAATEVQKVARAIETIENITGDRLIDAGRLRVAAGDISEQTSMIRKRIEVFAFDITNRQEMNSGAA